MYKLFVLFVLAVFSISGFAQDTQLGVAGSYETTNSTASGREHAVGYSVLAVKKFSNDIKIMNTFDLHSDESLFFPNGVTVGNNLNVRVPVAVHYYVSKVKLAPYVQSGLDFQKQFFNGQTRQNLGPTFGAGVEVGEGLYADYYYTLSPNDKYSLRQHTFGPEYYWNYSDKSNIGLFASAKYSRGNFEASPGVPKNVNAFKLAFGVSRK